MSAASLTLYHHGSSACAAKVRFALAEKQLGWESRYIDILKVEQFAPGYLAINPKAVVPALLHDGHVITESTLICEYIEDVFTEVPLYPATAYGKVEARYWTKTVDEELHPACSAITYVLSHRHTILRNGVGGFDDFLKAGGNEGRAARELKWQWIQQGIAAPGAADKIRLYLRYIDKMELALADQQWLLGDTLTIADVVMAPYVNRLSALAMEGVWANGRRPRVADWFTRIRQRPTFKPAFVDWMPAPLRDEMALNGQQSWPDIQALLRAQ